MREHGVPEIMTADTDFRKFPFLEVTDPLRGG
jgi:predicted nucleic acid-binding protein